MNTSILSKRSDLLGVLASGLCAVHCAVTPLLFVVPPLLGEADHRHAPGPWALLDYSFLLVSGLAVWYSTRKTDSPITRWVFWMAWGCFALGLLFEASDGLPGEWLKYAGSLALIITHVVNFRHCRKAPGPLSGTRPSHHHFTPYDFRKASH